MRIKFWGVRGSYPVPGEATNRYGGNTSCVQVIPDNGAVIILDAGTGIRKLGKELMGGPFKQGAGECHLLISHTHWDHIQGLPFFAPLYTPNNKVHIYARQRDVNLQTIFCSQTEEPYFPVSLEEVSAEMSYTELTDDARMEIAGVKVRATRLNHPFIALGYRLDADGAAVAYISDTAPFSRVLLEHEFISKRPNIDKPPPSTDEAKLYAMRRAVVELCRGCDLVIFDTMFRSAEYLACPHWGHSTPEHALEIVHEAQAGTLALFHHSPRRHDDEVDEDLRQCQARTQMEVIAAAEGRVYALGDGRAVEVG